MDDTTTLVSELLNKLAELDQKVCDYRTEMAQEFQRYSHSLLQDAPEHVAVRVEEVLAEELHNYSALGPGLVAFDRACADLAGRSDVERWPRRGRVSPPPVLPHTSGVPPNDVTSGSPPDRDRDREFHGLFTPSFLPLLEVMQPSKTMPAPTAVTSLTTPRDNESNITQEPSPHDQVDATARRPDLVHRHTEETMSSIHSDDSLLRIRRSALRRSSSGSTKDIQSPRRVRFDVEGEEVLPTVSPPTSPRIYELLTLHPPEDKITLIHGSLNHLDLEEETSILGNSPPRPKKISSTERLKALARSSREDTSQWTVVGDIHDDEEEEEGLVMFASKKKPQAPAIEPSPARPLENGTGPDHIPSERPKDSTGKTHYDQIDEGVDDILELTHLSSFKDKKRDSPPQKVQETISGVTPEENPKLQQILPSKTKPPSSALSSQSREVPNFEEEGMFEFDDDESALRPQVTKTISKYIQQVEPEVEEQSTPVAGDSAERLPVTLYSTSPAIPIAKPASLPPASPVSKHISASAGSYKGKPFIIGVVRDEEVHKRANEMGDFSTFVGSVDGRSGVDPSDSYRRDQRCFTGTPRSLGERLMEQALARGFADNVRKKE
ncbi:hypothetical protein F5Y12DRAFT_476485 [Xylaria sp. FL1777]|nr:hypothetical protein F5Y12DRAFT_476485 [Xylaria sp. FL1777]